MEKMSKSKYNVVNPDDIVAQYGADTFRMYEMFLGPMERANRGIQRALKAYTASCRNYGGYTLMKCRA